MEFLDTDEYIENKYNKLIKDIFRDSGEEAFRDMETQTIKELAQVCDNCVISVGGGLPVREVNRSFLKELGIVVYLEASVDELVKRLSKDTSRPLLAEGNLREKIESLMTAREELYKDAADVIVKTDGRRFEDMYADIVSAINKLLADRKLQLSQTSHTSYTVIPSSAKKSRLKAQVSRLQATIKGL